VEQNEMVARGFRLGNVSTTQAGVGCSIHCAYAPYRCEGFFPTCGSRSSLCSIPSCTTSLASAAIPSCRSCSSRPTGAAFPSYAGRDRDM